MRRLREQAGAFLRSEDGPTAVEYAVMLALIVVAAWTAISSLGSRMVAVFEYDYAQLTDAV
jgi:pilus assembly protein Flp/PilA